MGPEEAEQLYARPTEKTRHHIMQSEVWELPGDKAQREHFNMQIKLALQKLSARALNSPQIWRVVMKWTATSCLHLFDWWVFPCCAAAPRLIPKAFPSLPTRRSLCSVPLLGLQGFGACRRGTDLAQRLSPAVGTAGASLASCFRP